MAQVETARLPSLRYWRAQRGYTQARLASRIGMRRNTIWWIEAGHPVRLLQQLAIGQPGLMVEVVADDAGEGDAEGRVGVARVGRPARLERDQRVLPGAPVARGLLAHRHVWLLVEQVVVGSHQVAVARSGRHTGAKALPLVGKEAAGGVVQPVDVHGP